MDTLVIFGAKYLILFSVVVALYALYIEPAETRVRRAIIVFLTLALTYTLGKTMSYFYFDARPFVVQNVAPLLPHAADNGFPSDHTLLAAALASAALFFNRRVAAVLFVFAIAIGLARILALIHHPIDILGSIAIALLSAWIIERGARHFFK